MPEDLSPKKVQEYAHKGARRMANFRQARVMFLRNYVGPYYDQSHGDVGSEAMNLIFNAIRTLLPNIVMQHPTHNVSSRYLAYRNYAEMLSLALSQHDKESNIKDVYRRVIVDAIFTLGILKTGIAESDHVYSFADETEEQVDTGEVFTEAVDFDNFVPDPNSKDHLFRDASFLGDKICVPRQKLLDSGLYQNDLIEKLPSVGKTKRTPDSASELSKRSLKSYSPEELQDEVEIIELWMPDSNATVTIPGDEGTTFDDYLRVDDYYGPDEGPYTLLALTPPVPGNPLPVPAVGVWNDLHTLANQMSKKIIDQAKRQKDIVGYKRSAADDAEEAQEAGDGEAIAMDDPEGLRVHSFGGQQNSNEQHLMQLQGWFNMMAGNPQYTGGTASDADSATEARILAQNTNVGLDDMKGLVYDMAASEAAKRAWFFHTDPFIDIPLIRRETKPPQYELSEFGPLMTEPGEIVERQIYLTPEAREGNFLDFNFEVEPESMSRKDSQARFQEAMDFATKILPAAMSAAQTAAAMGIPFSAKQFLVRMAKDRGIDWMDEVFYDPEFQQQMMVQMLQMPGPEGSQGQPQGQGQGQQMPNANAGQGRRTQGQGDSADDLMTQILQNGQPGGVTNNPGQAKQERQQSQQGANQQQSMLKRGG